MAISPYSPHAFFRKVPHDLLARYFDHKQISIALNWSELKGVHKSAETIFQALLKLPEEEQAKIEVDFQNIHALASRGGIYYLNNEANFVNNSQFIEEMAKIDGEHAKSMWAFLHEKGYWPAASSLLHAKSVSAGQWKAYKGLPPIEPMLEEEDKKKLAKQISRYFNTTAGKGRHCHVDAYRDMETGKEYVFAYPEDYGQLGLEWIKEELTPRSKHPAFEIIFVYSQEGGFIDIYAPRNTKYVSELRLIFAEVVLGLDTLPDEDQSPTAYDLSNLNDQHFEFNVDDISDIKAMYVIQLRLTLRNNEKKKITIEANDKNDRMAVYDLLQLVTSGEHFPPYDISQTKIRVMIPPIHPNTKSISKDIRITPPYSCNLNHDGFDGVLRQVLANSNIQTPPSPQTVNTAA